ncbi:hypothetical protein Ait01nite_082950 [Actinoplanes italicus]|nr:hypothetical protein Ait01nite_082950 [Actinoplanes italicus]
MAAGRRCRPDRSSLAVGAGDRSASDESTVPGAGAGRRERGFEGRPRHPEIVIGWRWGMSAGRIRWGGWVRRDGFSGIRRLRGVTFWREVTATDREIRADPERS